MSRSTRGCWCENCAVNAILTLGWVLVVFAIFACIVAALSGCGGAQPTPAQAQAVVTEAQYEACNHKGLLIVQSARTCEEAVEKLQALVKLDPACAAMFGGNPLKLVCEKKESSNEVRSRPGSREGVDGLRCNWLLRDGRHDAGWGGRCADGRGGGRHWAYYLGTRAQTW